MNDYQGILDAAVQVFHMNSQGLYKFKSDQIPAWERVLATESVLERKSWFCFVNVCPGKYTKFQGHTSKNT